MTSTPPLVNADLGSVDEGVPIGFLGHTVGTYDYSAAAASFYRELAAGRLTLPYCAQCQTHLHPRREVCPNCLGDDLDGRQVEPRGTLYSFSTMATTPFAPLQDELPYSVGIVTLECGVGLFGRVHADPEEIAIGMALRVDLSRSDGLHCIAGEVMS